MNWPPDIITNPLTSSLVPSRSLLLLYDLYRSRAQPYVLRQAVTLAILLPDVPILCRSVLCQSCVAWLCWGCVAACMDISGLISCLGCQGSAPFCNRFAVQYDVVIVISCLLGVVIPCQAVSLYSKLSCLGHQGPAISCTRYDSLLILVVWLYYLV